MGPAAEQVPYGAAADYLVGRQLLKEGEFQEALQFLHPAYRMHPDVPAIALDFQEALVAEGYFNDALEVMDRLLATFPDSTEYLLQRSRLNVQLGKTREALADLRTVRSQGQTTPEMLTAEARLLAADGEVEQALEVLREGVASFPEVAGDMYLTMVRLLRDAGKNSRILPLLAEARQQHPNFPRLWLTSLHYQVMAEEHTEALNTARRADIHFAELEAAGYFDPDQSEGAGSLPPSQGDSFLVELADFYIQRGDVERAVGVLEPLAASGELKLNATLWLARIYLGTGQADRGKQLVDEILRRWPESGRGWFLRGKMNEAAEDWESAIRTFGKAVELAPHDAEIRLALVRAMLVAWERDLVADSPPETTGLKRERLEKQAVAALTLVPTQDTDGQLVLGYAFRTLDDPWRAEKCFEAAAADPEIRIPALTQRSLCFDEMGDVARARKVLEGLQKDFPDNPEVANSLGYFLAEKNQDLDKAQKLVALALEKQPGNGAFLDSMGWVLYRQGDLEGAFDFLIQAVNVLPDDPVILEHLGVVMVEMGQVDEGGNILRRSLKLGGDRQRIEAVLERLAAVDSSRSASQQ
jgi:tetratricopeptide (TPR) repeat protein